MNKLLLPSILVTLLLGLSINAIAQPLIIPLWEEGAPGFEQLKDEPELSGDWWVRNVHNPTANVFLAPDSIANGTAMVIFPGGGHQNLVYNSEGVNPAKFLNSLGIHAIVVKYRLARQEGSPYSLETHNAQDAHRGVRVARYYADEWGIDPDRIGVFGFSAGGETSALVAYGKGNEHQASGDDIDTISSKPNFQILVYPGPLFIPEAVSKDAPPTFAIVSNNDECCSDPVLKLLSAYRKAGVHFEAHIYGFGDHAFNMGYRSDLESISGWPNRLKDWLKDSELID
ncbi:MAG: alpha/beta hydrolase [Balneola sp.]|nr:MAG: alpha/beta hydrolase [Balneola sp.]